MRSLILGNSDATSLTDFIETIESELGRKAEKNMLPMQPGDVAETSADITKSRGKFSGFLPKTPLKNGNQRLYCLVSGVLRRLRNGSIERFNLRKYEGTAGGTHALGVEYVLQDHLGIMLHVPRNNFQHQINFSGHRKYADNPLNLCKIVGQLLPTPHLPHE